MTFRLSLVNPPSIIRNISVFMSNVLFCKDTNFRTYNKENRSQRYSNIHKQYNYCSQNTDFNSNSLKSRQAYPIYSNPM